MKVAVTGASGLVGTALVPALHAAGHDVVSLVRRAPSTPDEASWDPVAGSIDADALGEADAVVHLAGESIGKRWTASTKRKVLSSRVDGTRLVAEAVARLEQPPSVLVCASAVGIYGDRGDEILTEASPRGPGFLADVVDAWEAAADPARQAGIRTVHLRQGLILSRRGGALARMLPPFRLGVGGRVGDGRQWWSWVTLDDAVAAYLFALEHPLAGPVNLAAPGTVTNADFTRALGRALRRPALLPLPASAIGLAFGEMGRETLLGGQRVSPALLEAAGFSFSQPDLDAGLAQALRRPR